MGFEVFNLFKFVNKSVKMMEFIILLMIIYGLKWFYWELVLLMVFLIKGLIVSFMNCKFVIIMVI